MNRRVFLGVAALALALPPLWRSRAGELTDDLIGTETEYLTRASDTLADIAIRYDLGYDELVTANRGIDPWLPGDSTPIVLPDRHILPAAPRTGIVINLGDQRLYHFPPGEAPRRNVAYRRPACPAATAGIAIIAGTSIPGGARR
ncbi:hypothetical protein [Ferrovibrio xuzhouensis]|uniref:LysM domain-containing protein n=1 Tax=Ferrovibrio xuzhouensis TaxID=1576914 RepID=A0ABV7VBL3_9PROT